MKMFSNLRAFFFVLSSVASCFAQTTDSSESMSEPILSIPLTVMPNRSGSASVCGCGVRVPVMKSAVEWTSAEKSATVATLVLFIDNVANKTSTSFLPNQSLVASSGSDGETVISLTLTQTTAVFPVETRVFTVAITYPNSEYQYTDHYLEIFSATLVSESLSEPTCNTRDYTLTWDPPMGSPDDKVYTTAYPNLSTCNDSLTELPTKVAQKALVGGVTVTQLSYLFSDNQAQAQPAKAASTTPPVKTTTQAQVLSESTSLQPSSTTQGQPDRSAQSTQSVASTTISSQSRNVDQIVALQGSSKLTANSDGNFIFSGSTLTPTSGSLDLGVATLAVTTETESREGTDSTPNESGKGTGSTPNESGKGTGSTPNESGEGTSSEPIEFTGSAARSDGALLDLYLMWVWILACALLS